MITHMQKNWVKMACEKHGKHGPDGWKELTLEERKCSLVDLWKGNQEAVSREHYTAHVL